MNSHRALSDTAFKNQFADCSLDPALFSHEAHLRLAWIHLRELGESQALDLIQAQIQRYVRHLGAESKYNCTLTVAAVKAVHHFLARAESEDFWGFAAEFPRLTSDFRGLMASHYSHDIFNDPKAKSTYLEPDLLPFN